MNLFNLWIEKEKLNKWMGWLDLLMWWVMAGAQPSTAHCLHFVNSSINSIPHCLLYFSLCPGEEPAQTNQLFILPLFIEVWMNWFVFLLNKLNKSMKGEMSLSELMESKPITFFYRGFIHLWMRERAATHKSTHFHSLIC